VTVVIVARIVVVCTNFCCTPMTCDGTEAVYLNLLYLQCISLVNLCSVCFTGRNCLHDFEQTICFPNDELKLII